MTGSSDDLVDEMMREGAASRRAADLRRAEERKAAAREPKLAKAPVRGHPERDLQKTIVTLIRRCVPGVLVAAVTNEEQGHGDAEQRARFGAMRRASGVLTGHPDLVVYLPGGRVLLWELKAAKGVLSAAQIMVHAQLDALGHLVEVIRTPEAAMAALQRAGVGVTGRMRMAAPVEPLL